jgi:TRAP-type C4-dicarboxylate transport system permease small subunit
MILLFIYSSLIIFDVAQRILIGEQTTYGLPVVLMLFTWMAWLAASWGIRREAHLQFTLLRWKLSERANYILQYVDMLLWLAIMGTVFYLSVIELQGQIETSRPIIGTPIPNYTGYIAIPVGIGLLLIRVLQRVAIIQHKYKNGESLKPESSIE